jgi:hypothetical protein
MGKFMLGLIIGCVLGGAVASYYMNPAPLVPRVDAIQENFESARQRAEEATERAIEQLRTKLESFKLTAQDIRDELKQTGRIVRHNARKGNERS